jgi:hypothetical protein
MTQKEVVLTHLKSGKEITSAEAFYKYGISDLPKRISELRKSDYKITSRKGQSVNEYGTVTFNIYKLEDINNEQSQS